MTMIKRPACWIRGHDWLGWAYGYPTKRSVYQYNQCGRCGARKKHKIVGDGENVPSEVRREREKEPARTTTQTNEAD